MIYFNKLLPYLLYPSTIIIVLLIFAIVSRKRLPTLLALLLFLTTSLPVVSNQMVSYVEGQDLKKSIEDIHSADSIVVLSGMLVQVKTKQGIGYEWADPDRFFGGVELFKAGKATNIIFTGGVSPWQKSKPEGQILAKIAEEFSVPRSAVIVTKDVQNTFDEANAVIEILSKKNTNKIILVTSAFHMPRASRLFANQGIDVQTYPVDYKSNISDATLIDFLLSADAFFEFQFALRELMGRAYYKFF